MCPSALEACFSGWHGRDRNVGLPGLLAGQPPSRRASRDGASSLMGDPASVIPRAETVATRGWDEPGGAMVGIDR